MIYASGRMKDAHVDLSLVFQISAVGLFLVGLMLFLIKPKQERVAEAKLDSRPQVEAQRN